MGTCTRELSEKQILHMLPTQIFQLSLYWLELILNFSYVYVTLRIVIQLVQELGPCERRALIQEYPQFIFSVAHSI
jgi:hypothetical protein